VARVEGLSDVRQVAVGDAFSCALVSDGGVWCWGRNSFGELGNGSTEASLSPVRVRGLDAATQIALGLEYGCALRDTGDISCWGNTSALAPGAGAGVPWPAPVFGLPLSAREIQGGSQHACAVLEDSSVWCWGSDLDGQVGTPLE
jgi:alpha-tubulin suppressor-like RCC1 family protein